MQHCPVHHAHTTCQHGRPTAAALHGAGKARAVLEDARPYKQASPLHAPCMGGANGPTAFAVQRGGGAAVTHLYAQLQLERQPHVRPVHRPALASSQGALVGRACMHVQVHVSTYIPTQ